MADSFIIYTANGSQDTFNIPFGYLDPAHVKVSVNNVDVPFTFPSGAQVKTNSVPSVSAKVKVYRTTPRTSRQVVWVNASNLTAADLNASDLQLLYITQEAFDTVNDAVLKDGTGLYDAKGIRIINVAEPVALQDAATKNYVDTRTVNIVDDAEDARDAAIAAQIGSEAALAACQAVYDNFDDRYLGQKSSAPTVDNDGNPLLDGALYYNTVNNKMYVYDLGTTSWLAIETNIPDGSITANKLATDAVTTSKIQNSAVDGNKLSNGAVSTTAKMADGIVTYVKMASAAIAGTSDWAAGTASKLLAAANFLPALAAALGYSARVTSPAQSITLGTPIVWNHGLGGQPDWVRVKLVCKTADGDYAVGDTFHQSWADRERTSNPGVQNNQGLIVKSTATQCIAYIGSNGFVSVLSSTGVWTSLNAANWDLYFMAGR